MVGRPAPVCSISKPAPEKRRYDKQQPGVETNLLFTFVSHAILTRAVSWSAGRDHDRMNFLRSFRARKAQRAGFLMRLLRDRRGNTLALMAVALIPLSALAGSAVDMARLYVVKSRLQQACDAGVLAGRRFMDVEAKTLDANATQQAKAFFNNNIEPGWFDTGQASFTPVRTADNQVAGTAQVVVPMTIMKMFAVKDTTVKVACQARFDIADTDVVFVLDTTGSMACPPEMSNTDCSAQVSMLGTTSYTRPASDPDAMPGYLGSPAFAVNESNGATGSRIKALRQAVKDFYATMAASKDATTRVRYGFVSYTSTVNAGKAIYSMSPLYLRGGQAGDTASYQSRQVTGEFQIDSTTAANAKTKANCNAAPTRTPAATPTQPYTFATNRQAKVVSEAWDATYSRCNVTTKTMGPVWTYQRYDLPVTDYVTKTKVTDPSKLTGDTSSWDGCIEERKTEAKTYTFSSASFDLDPDLIPSASDNDTRWAPMWPDVEYSRGSNTSIALQDDDYYDTNLWIGSDTRQRNGNVSCGKPIHRLSEMTAAQVAAYVDAPDFRAIGGTYHDTGMIWGVRMLSTKGIFAADNTGRSGQGFPKKVIVFLTDGDMAPSTSIYGMYGYESYDKRVSGGDTGNLKAYHNARFLYECDKAREMGIDVWTVSIGLASTTELKKCARIEAQALSTTSGSGLSSAFQVIAKQVAMLRLQQ
jgi:Flp pilus assembly protein TadG